MSIRCLRCSFCDKTEHQISKLIAGPGGIYICNECIDLCAEIIAGTHAGEREYRSWFPAEATA